MPKGDRFRLTVDNQLSDPSLELTTTIVSLLLFLRSTLLTQEALAWNPSRKWIKLGRWASLRDPMPHCRERVFHI